MQKFDSDYQIEIDYDSKNDLAKTFSALSQIIEGEERFTNLFLKLLNEQDVQKVVLQKLETGSIKVFLRNIFENISDDQIYAKGYRAFIEQFLIEIKNYFLTLLSEETEITKDKLDIVKKNLIEEGSKKKLKNIETLNNLTYEQMLDCIDGIIKPIKNLDRGQAVRVKCQGREFNLNKDIKYDRSGIESIVIRNEISRNQELVFLVKKPDYIGKSKWEFYYKGEHISAKILHENWLNKFQKGLLSTDKIPLPGDSLRVRTDVIVTINRSGIIIAVEYEINEVLEVIKNQGIDEDSFDF